MKRLAILLIAACIILSSCNLSTDGILYRGPERTPRNVEGNI